MNFIYKRMIINEESVAAEYVNSACNDGYKRLIKPSVEREIRSNLKEKAEEQAIKIFSENLRNLLLQPPMKGKVVLGVDPAYRTGCKFAVVDETGKMHTKGVIYPHEKYKGEHVNKTRVADAEKMIKNVIEKYKCEIVAIGNGTASRETEAFIVDVLGNIKREVSYIIVSEAGASVYSASELAKEEFPNLNVEERSAISIARRLQDPLSELVKIDPKSIGVGQYQHDVTQSKLNDSLSFVVESAVNSVGVNVNSASVSLLQRVAGLNSRSAKNIVNLRDENGQFINRKQISKIKGIGPKTIEQAI